MCSGTASINFSSHAHWCDLKRGRKDISSPVGINLLENVFRSSFVRINTWEDIRIINSSLEIEILHARFVLHVFNPTTKSLSFCVSKAAFRVDDGPDILQTKPRSARIYVQDPIPPMWRYIYTVKVSFPSGARSKHVVHKPLWR